MDPSDRLALTVAEAPDAWLRVPRDATVYQLLIQAVERWRTHSGPELPMTAVTPELEPDDEPDVDLPGTLADGIRELSAKWSDR